MRISKTLQIASAALMVFGFASAAEIISVGQLSDFHKNSSLSFNSAEQVFSIQGTGKNLTGSKKFKLDPSKKYKLTGDFRMKPGTPPARLYFGYVGFTKTGKTLSPCNFRCQETAVAELAQPAKKGDKVLYFKDLSAWDLKNPFVFTAFDIKKDLSDLPNFNVYPIVKNSYANENGIWKVAIKYPMRKDYPAGTAVRQHQSGGTYIYNGGSVILKENWETRSGVLQGLTRNTITNFKFWPGMDQAKLLILVLAGKNESVVEFKNIKVEEIE